MPIKPFNTSYSPFRKSGVRTNFRASSGAPGYNALMGYMLGQQQREQAPQTIAQAKESVGGKWTPGSKVNITSRGADVSVPLNVDYTLDESRAMGMSDAFDAHVQFLEDQMVNNPNFREKFKKATVHFGGDQHQRGQILGFPTTWGDKDSQNINFSITDMADRLLRLRSGAQINEQEFNRLMGLLPSYINITDPSDTGYESIRTKLYSFKSEMNNIKGKLMEGGNYNAPLWEEPSEGFQGVAHPAYKQYLSKRKGNSTDNDPLGLFQ